MDSSLKLIYKSILGYDGHITNESVFTNSFSITISWRPNNNSQRYINSYILLRGIE